MIFSDYLINCSYETETKHTHELHLKKMLSSGVG